MARLPGLVAALALHDRRGGPALTHVARQVREAGLISSTTRGAGGAIMTFHDAATLLMATCGDASPQGAVDAVKSLRRLKPAPWDEIDRTKHEDLPERLAFLSAPLSFADALEQLIVHAPALAEWHAEYMQEWLGAEGESVTEAEFSMRRMSRKLVAAGGAMRPGYARALRIVCYVPGDAAEIHLGRVWKQLEEDNAFHEYYALPQQVRAGKRGADSEASSDCLVTIEVGLPTLLALNEAVRSRRLRRSVRA